MRALLWQDTDVLMIGEIRDAETAEIACRAGRRVRVDKTWWDGWCYLHWTRNRPRRRRPRQVDSGVERFIVQEVLKGVYQFTFAILYRYTRNSNPISLNNAMNLN